MGYKEKLFLTLCSETCKVISYDQSAMQNSRAPVLFWPRSNDRALW